MVEYNKLFDLTKNLHVLYAEDDESFRKDTCEILEYFFDHVDIASDGEEAYTKYLLYFEKNKRDYDIVITDISMPKIDGLKLTKLIRKESERQRIIIVSAYSESNYLLEFVNIGIEHFLVKPFELENLFKVLYTVSKKIISSRGSFLDENIIKLNEKCFWDIINCSLFCEDKEVQLTKKEILFMKLLAKNLDKITLFEEIYIKLWEDKAYLASAQTLNPIISRLKKKLPPNSIKSIYGLGYKFNI